MTRTRIYSNRLKKLSLVRKNQLTDEMITAHKRLIEAINLQFPTEKNDVWEKNIDFMNWLRRCTCNRGSKKDKVIWTKFITNDFFAEFEIGTEDYLHSFVKLSNSF